MYVVIVVISSFKLQFFWCDPRKKTQNIKSAKEKEVEEDEEGKKKEEEEEK